MADNGELLSLLAQQETALQFERFDSETALAVGLDIVAAAKTAGQAVTVQIARNGHLLFQHAMNGTVADQAEWIRRKNNVVQRFGHSSYHVGVACRERGEAFEDIRHLDGKDYAAHGGAFPLTIRGVGIVGTITVSGLPQAQDHALVVEALQRHLAAAPGA
jgi:uncharacterized protein (UPF0303 family)